MRQKLFKKYFGATVLIVLFSFWVVLLILTFVYNNYLSDEKYKILKKSCDSVSHFAEHSFDDDSLINKQSTYYIMSNLSAVSECSIYITDLDGFIKICSCSEWMEYNSCEHSGLQIDDNIITELTAGSGRTLTDLEIYNTPRYATASTITSERGVNLGYVVAEASIENVKNLMLKVSRLYLLSAILPVALTFVALYIMTYRLTRPLKLMSDAARAMANGDFSKRIPVTSDDEIGHLAVSFNQMTNSLARLEEMRKSFVADVSHELKTPMTTIGGFIDGIMDGTIETEKQSYYLQIVSDEVKRLSRMVESMLSLAQLESNEFSLKPEIFDLRELVLNVVISQERRIEDKELNISGLDELLAISVKADKDLIHRVVYNLVDNAIKFTNEKGNINFKLRYDFKNAVFTIRNTGKGIPQNELSYIFERFYKVDKSRSANKKSTGLGLYIAKMIIKNHRGTMTVKSVENDFTEFEFTLPINK